MSPALKVSDLHKHFGREPHRVEVLRGISFQLEAGACLAVTGPSGSGKSTLLHCLGTLTPPSRGGIEINELDPFALPEPELARFRSQSVGFVFQDHHLLPQYSLLENVLLPTLAFPPSRDPRPRARELLERVGLAGRLDHRPSQLSGGERQRGAVARALINGPRLLLCDEPTGNLDGRTADGVASLLLELHHQEGNLLVVVTHSLELAGRLERRFQLEEGRCAEV